jgi:ABC-2 type transport system ATP-binding protein
MDEPFSGLDPVNARLLEEVLLEVRRAGKTILFSTHRMDHVEKLCDSICVINRGQAVLAGELRQVKSRYARDKVQIVFTDGQPHDLLTNNTLVQKLDRFEGYVQVQLAPGADSQQLLTALAQRARMERFELMEPTLEDIFIEVVGKTHE